MTDTDDFIVVGGGASGCAVSSKLLSKNYKVCLFEAGYSHHNFLLDVPAGFFKLINNSKYATYDKTKPVGMIRKLVNTDLQTKLGWQPKISIEVGLKKTYEFYLKEIAK